MLVNILTRKKIIFVIVEDPFDEESLGAILSKFFDENEVHVEIMYTDIASKDGVTSTTILKEITNTVKEYAQRYHFKAMHFKKIIHIVDTDGVFVLKIL